MLELIDFKEKREYSLAKISEEIEAGSYEYVKTEPEKDAAQQGRAAQQGTSGTVLGADTATQEWQIAYEGDVSIRCGSVRERSVCGRIYHGRTGESGISALRQRNAGDVF